MRPASEKPVCAVAVVSDPLLILIGILYLLFGCIFGITTVKKRGYGARISAGDLVL